MNTTPPVHTKRGYNSPSRESSYAVAKTRMPPREMPKEAEVFLRMAAQFHRHLDATDPAAAARFKLRKLPPVYVPSIHDPVAKRVSATVMNSDRLYLQGAAIGVGTSRFLANYATSHNMDNWKVGLSGRMTVVRTGKTRSVSRFLRAIASEFGVRFTNAEIRDLSERELAARVLAAARLSGLCAIAFDHVSEASENVLGILAELMILGDPEYEVRYDPQDFAYTLPKVAIIVADHHLPELVFRNHPEVLVLLQGNHVVLPPFTSTEHFADALRSADIGLAEFDPHSEEGGRIIHCIASQTDGLLAHMEPLFRVSDLIARNSQLAAPNLQCFMAAGQMFRKLVDVTASKDASVPGGVRFRTTARSRLTQRDDATENEGPTSSTSSRKPNVRHRSDATHKAILQKKRLARDEAKVEGRAMRKKSGVTLP